MEQRFGLRCPTANSVLVMNDVRTEGERVTILLVEDEAAHAELVMRCFEHHRVANQVFHVSNGEDALNYLLNRGEHENAQEFPMPQLVLLDLGIPKVSGLEVLQHIKGNPKLQTIPVVILTTSEAENDVAKAYELHANSYVLKPLDFEEFSQVMDVLGFYWLTWNHPRRTLQRGSF